jgi:hypothetical protein
MVKYGFGITLCLFFAFSVSAQTIPENTAWQDDTVNVLYRIRFDEEFHFLVNAAGAVVWNRYSGPFPNDEAWNHSLEEALVKLERVAKMTGWDGSSDPIDQAVNEKIPVFLDIFVDGDLDTRGVSVSYTIRELFSEMNVFEGSFEETVPTQDDLLNFFWIPVSDDVEPFIAGVLKPPIMIVGVPGMVVSGFGTETLRIPETGILLLNPPLPGTYAWETTHKKYVARRGVFLADRGHTVLELPRQPLSRNSVDLGLYLARFPDLWYTHYFNSYGWFFSVGLEQQIFGIALTDDPAPLGTSFNSASLFMPGLSVGYRFRGPEPYLPKLYGLATVQARLAYGGKFKRKVGFDSFSPFSARLAVGYNWETKIKLAFFAELGAAAYFLDGDYRNSPVKGLYNDYFVQKIIGDRVYLELPAFRFGIRKLF